MQMQTSSEFLGIAAAAIKLSPEDQDRLIAMIDLSRGHQIKRTDPSLGELQAFIDVEDVTDYIDSIKSLPLHKRLQEIDEALLEPMTTDAHAMLMDQRARIINDAPIAGIRHAVFDFATREPLKVFIGTIGLGLAIVAASAGMFNRIF
jgi:hypothetical protein